MKVQPLSTAPICMGAWTEGKLAEPFDLESNVLGSPNLPAPTISCARSPIGEAIAPEAIKYRCNPCRAYQFLAPSSTG